MVELDDSWNKKADKLYKKYEYYVDDIYLQGASDFQEKVIEDLHKYRLEMVKQVEYSSELNSIVLDCVNVIKNLKAK